ncbi:MAG: Wzz/FepE/Etk N-terminal domain-containing protein [Nocardioidaceae bacterium]
MDAPPRDAPPRDDGRALSVTSAVRRHIVWIIVITVVAGLAAIGYAHSAKHPYTATAMLLPNPAIGNPLAPDTSASNGTQLTVAMQTEAGLVDTPAVSALASKSLGKPVPGPRDQVSATVPGNTQLIQVTYTSPTAAGARDGAQAFAKAFLQYRRYRAVTAQAATLSSLQQQARVTAASLQAASRDTVLNPNPTSIAAQQVQLFTARLSTLNDAISTAQAAGTAPGLVVTAATLPRSPSGLSPLIIVVVGVVLGLIIGLVVALWLESRSDLVHSAGEVDVGDTPFLAKLPQAVHRKPLLIADRDPDDEVFEGYRRLRAGLIATTDPPQVLSISGVSADQSSAQVAANLGLALSQAGLRVTVVAADPRDRGVEELLSRPAAPGLADVITGRDGLDDCVQRVHGISLVGGGSHPEKARELYAGPRLKATISTLKQQADYVIVSAASTSSADGDAVAAACDGVLIVVSDGHTTHAEAQSALDRFSRLGVVAVGAVSVPRIRRGGRRLLPTFNVSRKSRKRPSADVPAAQPVTRQQPASDVPSDI